MLTAHSARAERGEHDSREERDARWKEVRRINEDLSALARARAEPDTRELFHFVIFEPIIGRRNGRK